MLAMSWTYTNKPSIKYNYIFFEHQVVDYLKKKKIKERLSPIPSWFLSLEQVVVDI